MTVHFVNVFLHFFFWSLCVAELSDILQPVGFQTANLRDSATITCHMKTELKKSFWYKLTTGKRLELVVALNSGYNRSVFADEFRRRYSVKFDKISSHLSISAITWGDVGTYYCGVMNLNDVKFGPGTFLMIKGANMISNSVVQQPGSQSVQPGDSATLSCSVRSGHCPAEHTSVVWLKNSHRSAPQMVYTSGNMSHICQRTDSGETTCVHSLVMRSLSSDDAGTYYCVVTSCGQTLSGNGTRINTHNTALTEPVELSLTVIVLMLSNIILGIVTVILIWTLCKSRRNKSTAAADGSSESNQTSDAVVYAAVSVATRGVPTRQATVKNSEDSVLYSEIKYRQQDPEVENKD